MPQKLVIKQCKLLPLFLRLHSKLYMKMLTPFCLDFNKLANLHQFTAHCSIVSRTLMILLLQKFERSLSNNCCNQQDCKQYVVRS